MSAEKINAAKKALEFVKDGMVLGLGSGSTVFEFLKLLGDKVRKGKIQVVGVPTSYDTKLIAMAEGIPILQPEQMSFIDLAIDGADVVGKNYLIKGGGGALTREKIIAYQAKKFIVLADQGKVNRKNIPIPLEVLPFASFFIGRDLQRDGVRTSLRLAERKLGPVITDNGNFILDSNLKVKNPKKLEKELNTIPGVVENGIFTKFSKVIIGTKNGVKVR